MTAILEKILSAKRQEVEERKKLYPTALLEKSAFFQTRSVSLKSYLERSDLVGIIAEIKRRSPSAGALNEYIDVAKLSVGYMQAGASALSVLTDTQFFGGANEDLSTARRNNFCPILRKDFIIDPYQLVEAKAIGADVVLLIAAALPPKENAELAKQAKDLGMEVLFEVHSEEELHDEVFGHIDVVGVNNRDLKTFAVSLDTSFSLIEKLPSHTAAISESGLSDPADLVRLKEAGFSGFLIGERFMRHPQPEEACRRFIEEVEECR